MDLKNFVVSQLQSELGDIADLITKCADPAKGDYAIPCFTLAKEYKKSPNIIAEELASKLQNVQIIEKAEAVNGYLNLFLSRVFIAKKVIDLFNQNGIEMFCENVGQGKTLCIDYSSANLAKYLHIGHLSTTILGECIARIYETAGYRVVRTGRRIS